MENQENDIKVTLVSYYDNLPDAIAPKAEFIRKIIERCGVTQQAIYRWLKKGGMPSCKEHCDAVAEITGISAQELFPLYKEKFLSNEKN